MALPSPIPVRIVALPEGAPVKPAAARRARMCVRDYNTGLTLPGRPDAALIAESLAESSGTGAVPACCEGGVWKYIDPSRVDDYRRRGERVKVVFVEEV